MFLQRGISMNEQFTVDEATLDLRDVLRVVRKRWRLIAIIFGAAVLGAAIISWFFLPKVYEAETTLRIKQPRGLSDSLLGDLPIGNTMATKQLMSTYAEILKSRSVIEAVIRKNDLGGKAPPNYEDMLGQISTQPVKDTEILKVSVRAATAEQAQLLANTLVDTFIERLTTLVRLEQRSVREFIGERLIEAKADLEHSEAILEAYKRDQQIVAPADETRAMVDRMSAINKLVAENTVVLATSQARLISINQQLAKEKPGFIGDSPLIQQYKSKLADLEVQLVGLLQKYTEKHPQVLEVRAAIEETRQKLSTEIARVVNAEAPSMNPIHQSLLQAKIQTEAEFAAAQAQKEALTKILAQSEIELSKLPEKERGLVRVMRDASVAQDIYIMLAKRHEEARISEVMQPTDVQIIDMAVAPEQAIKPNKKLNLIIAAFLGLFAGTGLAFLIEYLNKTVATPDDVKHYLDLPVLGNIPDFEKEELLQKKGKK
jgi:succinoglycan biosynthesis transport protein ExoP